jgi:hypothetical protein
MGLVKVVDELDELEGDEYWQTPMAAKAAASRSLNISSVNSYYRRLIELVGQWRRRSIQVEELYLYGSGGDTAGKAGKGHGRGQRCNKRSGYYTRLGVVTRSWWAGSTAELIKFIDT